MSVDIKKRTIELYNEKKGIDTDKEKKDAEKEKKDTDKEKKDADKEKKDADKEKQGGSNIKLNVKDIDSSDTGDNSVTEHESDGKSDDSFLEEEKDAELSILRPPFFYIDYDKDNIQKAQNIEYLTLQVDKNDGLLKEHINQLTSGKLFDFKKTYLIINVWKVLTTSNLNPFSFDCTGYDHKNFERKMEDYIKWGSKPYLKERLTKEEQRNYSPFREGVFDMLKSLYHRGVKIFILSNSDYTFVKFIFEYYKIDKYIEKIFTPSTCGLPNGRALNTKVDFYKDRRKMNKERAFVCVERYVGRLPISA